MACLLLSGGAKGVDNLSLSQLAIQGPISPVIDTTGPAKVYRQLGVRSWTELGTSDGIRVGSANRSEGTLGELAGYMVKSWT
jgi:hypothetical protein